MDVKVLIVWILFFHHEFEDTGKYFAIIDT